MKEKPAALNTAQAKTVTLGNGIVLEGVFVDNCPLITIITKERFMAKEIWQTSDGKQFGDSNQNYINEFWAREHQRGIDNANSSSRSAPASYEVKKRSECNGLLKKGDFDSVINIATQILSGNPGMGDFYLLRAEAYIYKGNFEKAIADCNPCIKSPVEGFRFNGYRRRAQAYIGKGEYDKAIADCNEAIKMTNKYFQSSIYEIMGDAFNCKGNNEQAIANYQIALDKDAAETKELMQKFGTAGGDPGYDKRRLKQKIKETKGGGFLSSILGKKSSSSTPAQTVAPSPATAKVKQTFDNGDVYEGDFVNGNFHGKGKYTYADGTFYEGDFVNDKFHGKGKYTAPDGKIFEGDWKDGVFIGSSAPSSKPVKGKKTFDDGSVYEGDLVNGKMHGKGKYISTHGFVYEGDFVDDNYVEGSGMVITQVRTTFSLKKPVKIKKKFDNGDTYEGDIVGDNFHGKGKYTYADGEIYEGDFANNNPHGKGKTTFTDGGTYEGDFVDGKYHGKAKSTWPDGRVYIGEYTDGKRTGKGKMTYPDGRVQEGNWKDGEFLGK